MGPRPTTATTATLLPMAMVTFPMATSDTTLATTTARGPLMPSLLLMPTLVLATMATLLWPPLPLKPMPMPSTTMAMPTTDTVSTMATLLPTMDTMDTSATTHTPTCTTPTTDTITNLLIFVKN